MTLLQVVSTDCFLVNQNSCKTSLSSYADKKQIGIRSIDAHRGIIYDRNKEILAMSIPKKTLCININRIYESYIKNKINFDPLLNKIDMSKKEFNRIIRNNKNKQEYYLKRKLDDNLARDIDKLKLPHTYFINEYQRVYLSGESFSNVIGFTDIDDRGQEGIELAKNDTLKSMPGLKKIRKDNLGRNIQLLDVIKEAKNGADINLSFDKRIQFIGYKILEKNVRQQKAKSASLILVKNKTGEIISMINYPSFNPQNRYEYKGNKIQNSVVTELFEPGSTIKPFIIYAGLNNNSANIDDIIDTSSGFQLTNAPERLMDYKDLGNLTIEGILEKSSNVGAAKIAKNTKKKYIYADLQRLGFGEDLFIHLPGIQNGTLKNYHQWDEALHGTIGFGYGMSTSLLHLANAYTILANHGRKVQLTYEKVTQPVEYEHVLDKNISIKILKMMQTAVKRGTGQEARLNKYTVAGKTGTVRLNKDGSYSKSNHNAIFVGITPSSDPEYVAAIIIRDPKEGNTSGGKNAAPIFREFMNHALNILEVYPDIK